MAGRSVRPNSANGGASAKAMTTLDSSIPPICTLFIIMASAFSTWPVTERSSISCMPAGLPLPNSRRRKALFPKVISLPVSITADTSRLSTAAWVMINWPLRRRAVTNISLPLAT